jgi:hypothetical protein
MPSPEFFYEDLASETPVLCAPGAIVSFARANGLVHSLRIRCEPGSHRAPETASGERFVTVSPESGREIDPADPARVVNPVYQELVKHELPRDHGPGLCLLLTGSAFQHHFSAVFSLYREGLSPGLIVLDVDLADRTRAPIQLLAATYAVHHATGRPGLVDASPTAVAWRGGPLGEGTLELLAEPPARLGRPEARPSSTSVRIEARVDPKTFTQRLHYRWRWTSCAALTR